MTVWNSTVAGRLAQLQVFRLALIRAGDDWPAPRIRHVDMGRK